MTSYERGRRDDVPGWLPDKWSWVMFGITAAIIAVISVAVEWSR